MAKGKNMLGKFRGKVGATVFRTEAGIGQIASEYNPNPKNPRTLAQTKQRTKMNLAGLISSLTPAGALFGLDTKRRFARSAFVSNIIKQAVVSGTGTTESPIKAEIAPAKIIFSKGESCNVTDVSGQLYANSVSFRGTFGTTGNKAVAVMAIAMASKNGVLKEIGFAVKPIEVYNDMTSVDVNLADDYTHVASDTSKHVDLYYVPILETEGVSSAMFDEDVDWATSAYAVSVLTSVAALNAYGKSVYVGSIASE